MLRLQAHRLAVKPSCMTFFERVIKRLYLRGEVNIVPQMDGCVWRRLASQLSPSGKKELKPVLANLSVLLRTVTLAETLLTILVLPT
jgi:hypothetical protein